MHELVRQVGGGRLGRCTCHPLIAIGFSQFQKFFQHNIATLTVQPSPRHFNVGLPAYGRSMSHAKIDLLLLHRDQAYLHPAARPVQMFTEYPAVAGDIHVICTRG